MFYALMEEYLRYTEHGGVMETRLLAIYDASHLSDAIAKMVFCARREVWNVCKTRTYYVAEWKENEVMGENKIVAAKNYYENVDDSHSTDIYVDDEYIIPEDFLV